MAITSKIKLKHTTMKTTQFKGSGYKLDSLQGSQAKEIKVFPFCECLKLFIIWNYGFDSGVDFYTSNTKMCQCLKNDINFINEVLNNFDKYY